MTIATPSLPAGWYPAPAEPGLARYWDGSGWGNEWRPAPPLVPQPSRAATVVIVGFVLSLIGIVASLFGGGFLFGLVAIILLRFNKAKPYNRRLVTPTLVLGIIGIVVSIIIITVRVLESMPH